MGNTNAGIGFLLLALAALIPGAGLAAPAAPAVVALAPTAVVIDGDPQEWLALPPSFALTAHAAGGRGGKIWLGQHDEGLIIAGRIDGPPPRFAAGPAEMAGGDHLEVWVALTDSVPLPKVGWGHQFGPVEIDSADDCSKLELSGEVDDPVAFCRDWLRQQSEYRRLFQRLFVRQWQLAPAVAIESFARPAFDSLPAETRELISPLRPQGLPRALFAAEGGNGYGFEVVVPWAALPPSPRLDLDSLRILVDVFSPGSGGPGSGGRYGGFSSSAHDRRYGEVQTMNQVWLEPGRRWRLGACDLPLEAEDTWGEQTLPGYFLPTAGAEVQEMFVIENFAAGYQYLPEAVSPVVTATRLFATDLRPGVTLCGPEVAVRRGGAVATGENVRIHPGVKVAPVAGGWLVADGPWTGIATRFGTGACGACPLISLQVLFVPEDAGPPRPAFAESWLVEDEALEPEAETDEPPVFARNARVSISDDLRTVTVWEGVPSEDRSRIEWTRSRFCYDERRQLIAACGRPVSERPPAGMAMPQDEP